MTFTSDVTLNLTTGNTITFKTGKTIYFTTGITFQFTTVFNPMVEPCFVGQILGPGTARISALQLVGNIRSNWASDRL